MAHLTPEEIADIAPTGRRFAGADQREPLRDALAASGQYGSGQTAGRFYPMACVALEVTQRCNLDCTLCYLSEHAEAAFDVPMPALIDRIEAVASHYGPGTSIQISGGDPTLRKVEDLETLCREIRARGMRSCLMTNGIRAKREFLTRLAAAGLDDIAFHVDLTQERAGYDSEIALNSVREDYLARARGLGLRVLFNTTVFDGNFHEIPSLVAFFRKHASEITMTSFQMQAETGRGVLGTRDGAITQASVTAALEEGMGCELDFDVTAVGHESCNKYTSVLVAGGVAVSALANRGLFHRVFPALERLERRIDGHAEIMETGLRLALFRPWLALRLAAFGLGRLWALRCGMLREPKVHRMALLVHNFMDAEKLEAERCASCVFMVMTADGPISMCVHNARRDHHLFAPVRLKDGWWNAATGQITKTPEDVSPGSVPFKRLKGRQRAEALAAQRAAE
ncbi:MAG: radical SAM protein [Pseudomonadota bacterium]